MVSVYSNRSTTGSFVGSCRNGAVYDLSNHFMGSYRDGKIYNSSGSLIGSYNDESIYSYDTSYERIGYFGESTVYDLGNQARGECISDKGAHAAALIFFRRLLQQRRRHVELSCPRHEETGRNNNEKSD